MPKGSEELTNARKNEIISACAALYETMSFQDITLKEIGKQTSFTRTSIYNYFHTKEEIFLALLQREYEMWSIDLMRLHDENTCMTAGRFAEELAHTMEKRGRMLKLLSMNHYDLEARARMEKLVEFKVAYGNSIRAVSRCLEKFFPAMSTQDIQGFIYAFFPFLFGAYPYTFVTEQQRQAMERAGVAHVQLPLYEITYSCARRLLEGYGAQAT